MWLRTLLGRGIYQVWVDYDNFGIRKHDLQGLIHVELTRNSVVLLMFRELHVTLTHRENQYFLNMFETVYASEPSVWSNKAVITRTIKVQFKQCWQFQTALFKAHLLITVPFRIKTANCNNEHMEHTIRYPSYKTKRVTTIYRHTYKHVHEH